MTPSTFTIHITPVQRPGKYGPQWRVVVYHEGVPGSLRKFEGQLEAGPPSGSGSREGKRCMRVAERNTRAISTI